MRTKILYLSLVLCFIPVILYSQKSKENLSSAERKDSVGLSYYLLFGNRKDSVGNISNNWNEDRLVKPVTIGPEISGFFYYGDYPVVESYGISLAFYTGHSFSFDKWKQSFAEQSPMSHTYNDKAMGYRYSDTFIFFAPGISIFSKSRKVSIGLYQKLNTQTFVNGKQLIVPYKVNFHF
jgi:hypothetical protein